MQVTRISAFSLHSVLNQNARGIKLVGYTVKPGYSAGLFMTDRKPVGAYVGFSDRAPQQTRP